jgi:DNA-binding GntR family transcriptional regulator
MSEINGKKRAGNMGAVIYDKLRAEILNGTFLPGRPLSQQAIAKASGTSRGPVNDALRRLQQDRLVVARANQRFSVAPFDIADLEDFYCLYLGNNTIAVEISVPFTTDEDIQHLEHCTMLIDQAYAQSDDVEWDAAFHDFLFTIIKYASPRSIDLARTLVDEIGRGQALNPDRRGAWLRSADFRDIMEAVRLRNGKLAATRYAQVAGRLGCLVAAALSSTYDTAKMRRYIIALTS